MSSNTIKPSQLNNAYVHLGAYTRGASVAWEDTPLWYDSGQSGPSTNLSVLNNPPLFFSASVQPTSSGGLGSTPLAPGVLNTTQPIRNARLLSQEIGDQIPNCTVIPLSSPGLGMTQPVSLGVEAQPSGDPDVAPRSLFALVEYYGVVTPSVYTVYSGLTISPSWTLVTPQVVITRALWFWASSWLFGPLAPDSFALSVLRYELSVYVPSWLPAGGSQLGFLLADDTVGSPGSQIELSLTSLPAVSSVLSRTFVQTR